MTSTLPAISIQNAIDRYFAMWNERDPELRRRIIEQTWTPDASYIEQLMAVEGYESLDSGVAAMQGQFPGIELRLAGEPQFHHDRVRWRWELVHPVGDTPLAAGTNVGVLAADGRLSSVTGFFDHTDGIPADALPGK